jgi:diguanylate cyclase (GGDEF)-like protein
MADNDFVTAEELAAEPSRRALTGGVEPQPLWLLGGTRSSPAELGRAEVVVTDSHDRLLALLRDGGLPEQASLLLLGPSPHPPPLPSGSELRHAIDYLALPASRSMFRHRLALLSQMQRVNAENHRHSSTMNIQLDALFNRDGLTGLFNRRQLTSRLAEIFQEAGETGSDLAIVLVNIDYFNSINKSLGLAFGDLILNEMAARLTKTLRPKDSCYRFSGEEFVLVLPDTDLDTAAAAAARISLACSDKPFSDGSNSKHITVSIGITSRCAHQPAGHEQFLAMAETALFTAKTDGRNRIRSYQPQPADGNGRENSLVFLQETLHRIFEKTRHSVISSLELLAKNIAGPEHQAHIATVSEYLKLLGEHLGLPENHLQTFRNSITLYHSFRLLLHNDLISKAEELTAAEKQSIAQLPFKISEITDMFSYFSEENRLLQSHTERFDGTGYPLGLRGEEIPLGARIFNIVNSLAAMTGSRPYRRPLTAAEIITELTQQAGRQFDPALVLHLLKVLEKKNLLGVDPAVLAENRRDLRKAFPELSP